MLQWIAIIAILTLSFSIRQSEAIGVCPTHIPPKVRSFSNLETASTMWPTCQAVSTKFSLGASGGEFSSIGCTFLSFVQIDVTALWNNATAAILVADGTVQGSPSNGIGIVGPTAANSTLTGTFHITVQGMVFGPSAFMTFTGALPPGSSLVMEGNSFFLTQYTVTFNVIADVFAISIGAMSVPLTLTNGSYLSASNNSVGGNITGYTKMRAVYLMSTEVSLSNSSCLRMDGNVVQNVTTSSTSYAVQSNILNATLSNNSTISMSYNWVKNSSASFLSSVYHVAPYESGKATVLLSNRSSIVVYGNRIENCTAGEARTVYWSYSQCSMFLFDGSALMLNNNSAINVKSRSNIFSVYWYWPSISLNLTNGSRITGDENNIRTSKSGNMVAVYWEWRQLPNTTCTNNSFITLDRNTIYDSIASLVYAVAWVYRNGATLLFSQNSSMSLSRNKMRNVLGSGEASAVYIYWNRPNLPIVLNVSQSSYFLMNSNHISNVTADAIYVIRWYVPDEIFRLTFDTFSQLSVNNNTVDVDSNATSHSTVSLFYWYAYSGSSLDITSGARFIVEENYALRVAQFVFVGIPLSIENNGTVSICRNVATNVGGTLTGLINIPYTLSMARGLFLMENNYVQAQYGPASFLLANVSSFTSTSESIVMACNNILSWDASSTYAPTQYLAPASFSHLVTICARPPLTSTSTAPVVTTLPPTTTTTIATTTTTTTTTAQLTIQATTTTRPVTSTQSGTSIIPPSNTTTGWPMPTITTTSMPSTQGTLTSTTMSGPPSTTTSTQSAAPVRCFFEAQVVSQQGATLAAINISVFQHSGTVSNASYNANGTITAIAVFCTEADRTAFITAVNSGQVPAISYAAAMSPNSPYNNSEESSNPGMIIGVIVGAVVLVVVVSVVVYFVFRSNKRNNDVYEHEMNGQLLVTQKNLLKVEPTGEVQL